MSTNTLARYGVTAEQEAEWQASNRALEVGRQWHEAAAKARDEARAAYEATERELRRAINAHDAANAAHDRLCRRIGLK